MATTKQILLPSSVFSSSHQPGVKEKCRITQKICGNLSNQTHLVCPLCTIQYVQSETLHMTNSVKQEPTGMTNYPALEHTVCNLYRCVMLISMNLGLNGSLKHYHESHVSMTQEHFNSNSLMRWQHTEHQMTMMLSKETLHRDTSTTQTFMSNWNSSAIALHKEKMAGTSLPPLFLPQHHLKTSS